MGIPWLHETISLLEGRSCTLCGVTGVYKFVRGRPGSSNVRGNSDFAQLSLEASKLLYRFQYKTPEAHNLPHEP